MCDDQNCYHEEGGMFCTYEATFLVKKKKIQAFGEIGACEDGSTPITLFYKGDVEDKLLYQALVRDPVYQQALRVLLKELLFPEVKVEGKGRELLSKITGLTGDVVLTLSNEWGTSQIKLQNMHETDEQHLVEEFERSMKEGGSLTVRQVAVLRLGQVPVVRECGFRLGNGTYYPLSINEMEKSKRNAVTIQSVTYFEL